MRYLVGLMCVLVGLATLPLGVGAQDAEEAATAEPGVQEPAPPSEPAPKEPALQLKLDDAGVEVVPPPPRTTDGYTLEEMELRVTRAKIGLGVSGGVLFVGTVMMAVGFASFDLESSSLGAAWAGVALMTGGFFGMITAGSMRRARNRKLGELQEAHYGKPRRVHWDLAQSRLVF